MINRPASDLLALLAITTLAACFSSEPADIADTTWVGTITTEGNVTTVINESGSVWGGTATLVEEASIGVESGPEEYMFGFVSAVHAADDRIFLIDAQAPVVRAYDKSGTFVGNIGRSGQGPGEYNHPTMLTTDAAGRVFVFDRSLARINVYSSTGEVLDTWPLQNSGCCIWQMYPIGGEGIWAPVQEWVDRSRVERRYGVRAVGPEGRDGETIWIPHIDYDPITYDDPNGYELDAPFAPQVVWSPSPGGRLIAGASDRYRFEVLYPDGSKRVVERFWDPVPVPEGQRDWHWRALVALYRGNNQEIAFRLGDMPTHQPAYSGFIPAFSGETWVARNGTGRRIPGCAESPAESGYWEAMENPCWSNDTVVDAFDTAGRFLGEVSMPQEVRILAALMLSVSGRQVVGAVQDDAGTIMVKRYRLVLPGER